MQSTLNKKAKVTSIIFIIYIILITILAIGFVFFMSCNVVAIDNFDEIKTVDINDYREQGSDEYYVLVYNNGTYKDELLEEIVVDYAEYARTSYSARAIYVLDYSTNKDIISKDHMDITNSESSIEKNIPALLLIKDGKISETKTTVSTIKTVLYNEIK